MRSIDTNAIDAQWKTLVIGGSVYLYHNNYNAGRPLIGFTAGQIGRFTLIRAASFIYQPTLTTLSPGADLLPYLQIYFPNPELAVQSLSIDSTGGNAILVTRLIAD